VRRIADQREARTHVLSRMPQGQWESGATAVERGFAQDPVAGRGDALRELGRIQRLKLSRLGGRSRPHERNTSVPQRQERQRARRQEALVRRLAMRPGNAQVRDHGRLVVRPARTADAGLLARRRRAAVRADDEAATERAAVGQ